MKVAVLAGGRSSEHDVSLHSAAAVHVGVAAAGHEVLPVTIVVGKFNPNLDPEGTPTTPGTTP